MPLAATRIIVAVCCLLAGGCTDPAAIEPLQQRFYAMGTWVDVTLGPGQDANGTQALRDIETLLRTFERDYYPWAPGALAELNTAIAEGREIVVDDDLAELLVRARELSRTTDGLFEPGLGSLVELWGFHTTASTEREPPSRDALAATLAAAGGIAALEIDGARVRSATRRLKLDLGGIAKGAAVAEIMALLESRGITSALVNAGGDLMVAGRAAGGRPWRVGIRHPRDDGLLGVLDLGDGEAAFTSGDYERYYELGGERMHHLLDPSTGRPVAHTQALTVLAPDPVLADAAATALFVAGPDRWRGLASRLGLDAVLRVDSSGAVEMTDAMATRVTPSGATHDMMVGHRQAAPP